jgi:hypothetical protein
LRLNELALSQAAPHDLFVVREEQQKVRLVLSALDRRQAELVQQAHDLLGAPQIFGLEFGFNLPAFVIALLITAIPIAILLRRLAWAQFPPQCSERLYAKADTEY